MSTSKQHVKQMKGQSGADVIFFVTNENVKSLDAYFAEDQAEKERANGNAASSLFSIITLTPQRL